MRRSHPHLEPLSRIRRAISARHRALSLCTPFLLLLGCNETPTDSAVTNDVVGYREAVEQILNKPRSATGNVYTLRLPSRAARRMEVGDQRITPLDFLAIIGCPLSEIVAERNAPLGKVLVPTRRLAHEWLVVDAIEDCLPALTTERAERLRVQPARKRAELPLHRWNGVWLDRDLERFLSGGPSSLIGGERAGDGPQQLIRAARAIEARDASALEGAFEQVRDEDAMGPRLRALAAVAHELELVATLIEEMTTTVCDKLDRKLIRTFREEYMPIQPALGALDRMGRDDVEGIAALFRATAQTVEPPEPMARFRFAVRGSSLDGASEGVWARYRQAVLSHAAAWAPLLERCAGMPNTLP